MNHLIPVSNNEIVVQAENVAAQIVALKNARKNPNGGLIVQLGEIHEEPSFVAFQMALANALRRDAGLSTICEESPEASSGLPIFEAKGLGDFVGNAAAMTRKHGMKLSTRALEAYAYQQSMTFLGVDAPQIRIPDKEGNSIAYFEGVTLDPVCIDVWMNIPRIRRELEEMPFALNPKQERIGNENGENFDDQIFYRDLYMIQNLKGLREDPVLFITGNAHICDWQRPTQLTAARMIPENGMDIITIRTHDRDNPVATRWNMDLREKQLACLSDGAKLHQLGDFHISLPKFHLEIPGDFQEAFAQELDDILKINDQGAPLFPPHGSTRVYAKSRRLP